MAYPSPAHPSTTGVSPTLAPWRYREACGGCRIRAETVFGDPWAEDPACCLTDGERAASGRA